MCLLSNEHTDWIESISSCPQQVVLFLSLNVCVSLSVTSCGIFHSVARLVYYGTSNCVLGAKKPQPSSTDWNKIGGKPNVYMLEKIHCDRNICLFTSYGFISSEFCMPSADFLKKHYLYFMQQRQKHTAEELVEVCRCLNRSAFVEKMFCWLRLCVTHFESCRVTQYYTHSPRDLCADKLKRLFC